MGDFGLSEQDLKDAKNLEKLYGLIKDNPNCAACGKKGNTHVDPKNGDLLCANCGPDNGGKRVGESSMSDSEMSKVEKKYGKGGGGKSSGGGRSRKKSVASVGGGGGKDYWACKACTFHNKMSSDKCEMCLTPKGQTYGGGAAASDTQSDSGEIWACKACTFHNKMSSSRCEICLTPKGQTYAGADAASVASVKSKPKKTKKKPPTPPSSDDESTDDEPEPVVKKKKAPKQKAPKPPPSLSSFGAEDPFGEPFAEPAPGANGFATNPMTGAIVPYNPMVAQQNMMGMGGMGGMGGMMQQQPQQQQQKRGQRGANSNQQQQMMQMQNMGMGMGGNQMGPMGGMMNPMGNMGMGMGMGNMMGMGMGNMGGGMGMGNMGGGMGGMGGMMDPMQQQMMMQGGNMGGMGMQCGTCNPYLAQMQRNLTNPLVCQTCAGTGVSQVGMAAMVGMGHMARSGVVNSDAAVRMATAFQEMVRWREQKVGGAFGSGNPLMDINGNGGGGSSPVSSPLALGPSVRETNPFHPNFGRTGPPSEESTRAESPVMSPVTFGGGLNGVRSPPALALPAPQYQNSSHPLNRDPDYCRCCRSGHTAPPSSGRVWWH
uniref:RanBP2-type domain-containing protein n=1 Tax=Chromera velia CCMP2878 TaxID=1169474 RepID=A0A0G4GE46_9ALVE|eukprot:Cvel_21476.t1-p1 / transcript=Cvel_21476.t1 / gene=Cvel_21476 / organism=Chromera_velia_CCMP2878 / gene_product=hypothetical protein / transcript_product=hypothetical protein / location=Cvel_scaffold2016:28928-31145(-) / protein_length=597 / sequence_SO=supercontig / SO=protein_coding / is_pseudo=false